MRLFTNTRKRDFDENYSPTVKYESLCIILHLAAVFDWEIIGIDVENDKTDKKVLEMGIVYKTEDEADKYTVKIEIVKKDN